MKNDAESEALHLVGLLYDSAFNNGQFTGALQQIAHRIQAKSLMVRVVDYHTKQILRFDTIGYDPACKFAYTNYYIALDPCRDFFETAKIGVLQSNKTLPNYQQMLHSEYYNDYMRPQEMEHVLGGVLAREQSYNVTFGCHRNKNMDDFSSAEYALLQQVLPHLVRALKVNQLCSQMNEQRLLMEAALNKLRVGVILCNAQAQPIFINYAAEQIARDSAGLLSLSTNRIMLNQPQASATLHKLISQASAISAGEQLSTEGAIRIKCHDKILQFYITPLSAEMLSSEWSARSASAIIFISSLTQLDLPWQKLAIYYGLTAAEAKLAAQLVTGICPEEAALNLQISIHTARTQLKSIFAKTGVTRQTELITLLLQGVLASCIT